MKIVEARVRIKVRLEKKEFENLKSVTFSRSVKVEADDDTGSFYLSFFTNDIGIECADLESLKKLLSN